MFFPHIYMYIRVSSALLCASVVWMIWRKAEGVSERYFLKNCRGEKYWKWLLYECLYVVNANDRILKRIAWKLFHPDSLTHPPESVTCLANHNCILWYPLSFKYFNCELRKCIVSKLLLHKYWTRRITQPYFGETVRFHKNSWGSNMKQI